MRPLFWPKVALSVLGGALRDLRAAITARRETRRAFLRHWDGCWLTAAERQHLTVTRRTP